MNSLNIQNFNYFEPTLILCASKVTQSFFWWLLTHSGP